MNHSSVNGAEGYPQDGIDYPVDPNLLNESSWALPPDQYTHHDNFAPQQPYQQYSAPPTTYGGYGVPQESPYPVPSYTSTYAPQYQHQNHLGHYPLAQYALPLSQGAPISQQSYPGNSSSFPYSTFSQEAATISPHALQKINLNIPQTQRSVKTGEFQRTVDPSSTFQHNWDRDTVGAYQHHNAASSVGAYDQQALSRGGPIEYPSLANVGPAGSGQVGGGYSLANEASRNAVVRKGKPAIRQSSLRVTHPDLLSLSEKQPSRRLSSAPFVVLDEVPIELELIGKTKVPTYKPLTNRSGKPLVPGLENLNITSSSSETPAKKVRVRPSKSLSSVKKAKSSTMGLDQPHVKDAKSRPIAGSKPIDSPSPLEETSTSEEELSTTDNSEDEDEEEMPEENISDVREEIRPADPVAAAAWDATGILWAPRHRLAQRDEIIKAAPDFEKFIAKLRDDLKAASTALAAVDAQKRPEDAKRLKDARTLRSRIICSAIQSAIKNGHREILEYLGKTEKLVVHLVSVLMDCIKAKDFDGELPRATLILMSRFHYLTDHLLQRAKFDGVERRFNLNASAEIKGYIDTIRSNTPEGKERAPKPTDQTLKDEKQKAQVVTQEAAKVRKVDETSKLALTSSGLKRSLESDANSGKPNKKIASDATAVGLNQKLPTVKPRATNFFASLKRPGTKSAAAAKISAVPTPIKKPEPKPEPVSTPQSSLAAILASIEQPREIPKPAEEPARPPETPEEKAKRERKESRRHLRVRWKDGAALVEVKLFRHEQAEDEGRQDNMLRDAHDDRSEGMMLKQRVLDTMPDDEDDAPGEIEYRSYPELMSIDFSRMDSKALENNYATKGGKVAVSTLQQQIQERRESLELMVVYTDPKDIPPSPKEPPQLNDDKTEAERTFGSPNEMWLIQRLQEIRLYGYANAISIFVRRLEGQRKNVRDDHSRGVNEQSLTFASQSGAAPDIASILNAMNGLSTPQQYNITNQPGYQSAAIYAPNSEYSLPGPQPTSRLETGVLSENSRKMDPADLANLERIVASLKGKPFPAVEPPEWMTEKGKAMWWEGYNRDKAVAGRKIAEARAAQMQSTQAQNPQTASIQTQPQMTAPQIQYPQVPSYSVPPPSNMTPGVTPSYDISQLQNVLAGLNNGQSNIVPPDLQNILAGFTNTQANQASLQQQQLWASAWQATSGGTNNNTQSYPLQNQQPRWDSSWATASTENTRNDSSRPTFDNSNQDGNKNRSAGNTFGTEERARVTATGEYKGRKKPCKFWQEGKCAKGTSCTFLHD